MAQGCGSRAAEVSVSAKQLVADYSANEIAADSKYKKKNLQVSGIVQDIGIDRKNQPHVTFQEGVEFVFRKSQKAELEILRKGRRITITGRCEGLVAGRLVLVDSKYEQSIDELNDVLREGTQRKRSVFPNEKPQIVQARFEFEMQVGASVLAGKPELTVEYMQRYRTTLQQTDPRKYALEIENLPRRVLELSMGTRDVTERAGRNAPSGPIQDARYEEWKRATEAVKRLEELLNHGDMTRKQLLEKEDKKKQAH